MSMVAAGMISAGASIIGGIMGMGAADAAAAEAAREKARLQAQLDSLEKSRQEIINPYETTKDVSGLAKNLSGMITNPYASLGVATQSSKFEAEQTDIALANTLDTLKETGSSAGGATALAQAALKSKQGISANLEQQEAANEKLRAQGESDMQRMKMAEEQRIQGVQMSEAQRVQGAEAAGKTFMFGARENREQDKIDRVAAQLSGAQRQEAQARADKTSALTGMIGGIASAAGGFMSAGGGSSTGVGGLVSSVQSPGLTSAGLSTGGGATFSAPLLPGSDRRLKENIKNIGISPKGLNIYSFEYKDKKYGKGLFQGVMSDEIPINAVIKGNDGYDRVNYSLLDVEFKQI